MTRAEAEPPPGSERTWRATLALLSRMPQPALSRAFGRLADIQIPGLLRRTIFGAFARAVRIDLSDLAHPLDAFPTLNAFFTRPLRPGARIWPQDESIAGSPVDGVLGQLGEVRDGELLQAKGRTYSAARLLGDSAESVRFEGGVFLTIYLSPRHYHRIHAPTGDAVVSARHLPGALLPVNGAAVRHVPELFPRNERLAAFLEGALGRVAVVAIGAYNVGRISAAFDPTWGGAARRGGVTNRPAAKRETTRGYSPAVAMARGEELMTFHLGSTVVLLFERGTILEPLEPGAEVRLGNPIARRE